ncbi:MAG: class I SAM-dependent methyltransferase [Planctomycetes bacterium]|nr:class I SAM-dependent methyltransferase [Planctomycetota bacterium]
MKFFPNDPPREFKVGRDGHITLRDCGRIELSPDEQITLVTQAGGQFDVARKEFGFYATPSLNGRLVRFGLRPALVKSPGDLFFILLVEKGSEKLFKEYMADEKQVLICWLDTVASLGAVEKALTGRADEFDSTAVRCICGGRRFQTTFKYSTPPAGEVRFKFSDTKDYRRSIFTCTTCGHMLSVHEMDMSSLYSGQYVDSTYGDAAGLKQNFERIMSLPEGKSDNLGRVDAVCDFAERNFGRWPAGLTLLDIGSGLCVFAAAMKARGFDCTALDPDARAVEHAQKTAGVRAVCKDFLTASDMGQYDIVTFNKVIEHVRDPVTMLARSRRHLKTGGFVYVELPDGEAAAAGGPGREEFFIDHWHAFSTASTAILAAKAGLRIVSLTRLREPSTKYTIRAFLVPA